MRPPASRGHHETHTRCPGPGSPGRKVRQTPARLITSLRDRGLHGRAVRPGCPGSTPGATVHEPGDLEGVRRPCRVVLPRTSRGGLLPAGKSSAQPGERARPVPRGARPCLCYSRLLPSAPCSPEKPPPKNPPPKNPAATQVPFTSSLQPQCPARPHGGLSNPRSLNGILNSVPHSYQLHCKRLTATCDWELPSWTRVTDGLSGQPQPGGPSPGAAALAHCNPPSPRILAPSPLHGPTLLPGWTPIPLHDACHSLPTVRICSANTSTRQPIARSPRSQSERRWLVLRPADPATA